MSMVVQLRGRTSAQWVLSANCLGDIDRVRRIPNDDINVIFGGPETQAGTLRTVSREALLYSVSRLIPIASKIPKGFQLHVPAICGLDRPIVGAHSAGVTVGGKRQIISCVENYWTLQSYDEFMQGREPVERHYEPAEVYDEQLGISVRIELKSGPPELASLLLRMKKALSRDTSPTVKVIWG